MNPFLVFGMIIAWFLAFLGFFLAYLDKRPDTQQVCFLVGLISMVFAIFLLLICGTQWQHLHPV